MGACNARTRPLRLWFFLIPALLTIAATVAVQEFEAAAGEPSASATYSHRVLNLTLPYQAGHTGSGRLTVEVLDPEDRVLGTAERSVEVAEGKGAWQEQIKIDTPLSVDDLVWHRVHYRFEYDDDKSAKIEGIESISQILRTPVIHILGQQSYLTGGPAAVRVIVTDSKNEVIAGPGSVQIELLGRARNPRFFLRGVRIPEGPWKRSFAFQRDWWAVINYVTAWRHR